MWVYADTLEEVTDIERELSVYFRSDDIAENITDDLLNECYPVYEIAGEKFYPSEVVKKLARPLYNQILEEEIEGYIDDAFYEIEQACPNGGDRLSEFTFANIDYIIWKEDNYETIN